MLQQILALRGNPLIGRIRRAPRCVCKLKLSMRSKLGAIVTGSVAAGSAATCAGHSRRGAARTATRAVSPLRPRDTRSVDTPRLLHTHSSTQQAPSTNKNTHHTYKIEMVKKDGDLVLFLPSCCSLYAVLTRKYICQGDHLGDRQCAKTPSSRSAVAGILNR